MQGFEANDSLYQDTPNLMLFEELFLLFMVNYLLIEITVIGKLHHNTEILSLEEHLFVPDDIFIFEAGQDAHLV